MFLFVKIPSWHFKEAQFTVMILVLCLCFPVLLWNLARLCGFSFPPVLWLSLPFSCRPHQSAFFFRFSLSLPPAFPAHQPLPCCLLFSIYLPHLCSPWYLGQFVLCSPVLASCIISSVFKRLTVVRFLDFVPGFMFLLSYRDHWFEFIVLCSCFCISFVFGGLFQL